MSYEMGDLFRYNNDDWNSTSSYAMSQPSAPHDGGVGSLSGDAEKDFARYFIDSEPSAPQQMRARADDAHDAIRQYRLTAAAGAAFRRRVSILRQIEHRTIAFADVSFTEGMEHFFFRRRYSCSALITRAVASGGGEPA
jgi:hypothetical protein